MTEMVEVCRVKKLDTLYGTFYVPERRVWKTRWFSKSGYEWEYFTYWEYTSFGNTYKEFKELDAFDMLPENIGVRWKDSKWAERICKRYMEVEYGEQIVKTWSIEE